MATTNKDLRTVDRAELLRKLTGMTDEEKRDLIAQLRPASKKVSGAHRVPQTDDELHEFIIRETGYNIPRVAVCEGHSAPFDFIADGFFERHSALFLLGSRELGKTLGVAILHYVNSECRPRCESITFGAIEAQAKKAYEHVKSFVYDEKVDAEGNIRREVKPQIVGEPLRSETRWKNGSKVEIIIGTERGVNSPHGQKVHADEVDLMERPVWQESRSISSSRKLSDGTYIAAQDYATSTRKSTTGLVQEILNEVEEAVKQGYEPPWKVYTSCIFESAEEVPTCRMAPAEERTARLTKLGEDPCGMCDCDKVVKGEWAENQPRTLDTVCRGRFFRSRGWMPHDDVKRKFRQNLQSVWEAQMECRRPMADGLYLQGWTRERFTARSWIPRPEYGQVWLGVDWGGGAESAILWIQGPLRVPVKVIGAAGRTVIVPMHAFMIFDELLAAGVGATKLANQVVAREVAWRREVPGFRVSARFADMAGRQQRDDWREHDPPLRTVWYISRDFDPTVKTVQGLVEDGRYWVNARCARHCDDIESWRQIGGREVHDDSSHSMAAARYALTNVVTLERRRQKRTQQAHVSPVVMQRKEAISPMTGTRGDTEAWRGMGTRHRSDAWRP